MSSSAYCFHGFRLDPASRELWRGKEEVTLQLKVFDCILYLIEHRDRAVGRNELIDAVWGEDVHLSDSVLGKNILLARRAFDDTLEEQRFIKTIRGFGYRWVAPVEVEEAPTARRKPTWKRVWRWVVPAALALATLAAATFLRRQADPSHLDGPAWQPDDGNIALLLPVTVDAETEGRHAWIRLGVMDLIAERLRAAGQPMVPSDTVIALSRGLSDQPAPDDLGRLATPTGAGLILSAEAEPSGPRWRISLRSLLGPQPPLTALGEAEDILEAARLAADRMALYLGLTPAPEPEAEPGLETLVRQIEAARLAQRHDTARVLVESADRKLRQHPEIRLRLAHLDVYDGRLDAAQEVGELLLEEASAEGDTVFRARVLNHLAAVHATRGDLGTAEPLLEEAARLLGEGNPSDILGVVRMNLGSAAAMRGDFDTAREQMAQARQIHESHGDLLRLAGLDANVGVLEARRHRYPEALRYFENAAEHHAALQDIGGELRARANMIWAHLRLLDPMAALTVEPRVTELLAQTTDLALSAEAKLSKVELLEAIGRRRAAKALLDDVVTVTESVAPGDLRRQRLVALEHVAEIAAREGDAHRARSAAGKVVGNLAPNPSSRHDETLGRAWLILVRAHLALGDLVTAASASAALTDWANRSKTPSPDIYATLAQAELAAAEGRSEAAEAAFERSLVLADSGLTPLYLLWVSQSYVSWMLSAGTDEALDVARALAIADRFAGHADNHYDAALLQLRVYHSVGPPSAWRSALSRATALAGERQIPPELLVSP